MRIWNSLWYGGWLRNLHSILDIICSFFFFNDTATTEFYTLPLHDALPIWMAALTRPTARSVQTLCARLLRSGRPASATSYPRLSTRSATTPLASLDRPQRNNTRSLALAPLRSSSTDTAELLRREIGRAHV